MTARAGILLLAGLLVVAGGWYLAQRVLQPAGTAEAPGGPVTGEVGGGGQRAGVEDLQLESLEPGGDDAGTPDRNPFRFEQRRTTAVAPPPARVPPPADFTPQPFVPSAPPGPPSIPLRYIGFFDELGDKPRIAVLSDGRGSVFNGREGDIIDGRYRLERIGTESADLAYVDGRGRQTLRLSGQ